MKMKQKVAATLAGVMALSMVPATSVFAYSANKVTQTVKGNTSGLNLGVNENATSIVFEVTGEIKKNDTFILTNNAKDFESAVVDTTEMDAFNARMDAERGDISRDDYINANEEYRAEKAAIEGRQVKTYSTVGDWVYYLSGKELHVKYTGEDALKNPKLEVPIDIKNTKSEGDIVVTVDSNGTAISSGEYVVGTVVAKGVTAKIATAYLPDGATKTTLGKLTLTENIAGMLPSKDAYITLKLSNSNLSFKPFNDTEEETTPGSGVGKLAIGGISWSGKLGATSLTDSDNTAYVSDDGSCVYIPVSLKEATTSKGFIELAAGKITVYKDPDVEDYIGDVQVRLLDGWVEAGDVHGEKVGVTETKLTIFSDKAQSINVKAGSATTLVAGRLDATDKEHDQAYTNATHKTATVTVTEDALGSIDGEIKFTFPEGVKILAVDVTDGKGTGLVGVEVNGVAVGNNAETAYDVTKVEESMSRPYRPEVVITVDNPSDVNRRDKADMDFVFYLSVSADYEYDTVDVEWETAYTGDGGSIDGVLTLAKVQKPVEVYAESTVIDSSLKRQELGDITIKENIAGGLVSGDYVYVEIEDGIYFDEDEGKISVKSGDIVVSKLKQYFNADDEVYAVGFYVDEVSTKASEIVISGLQTSTKNTAGGYYELSVYGNAIANNNIILDEEQSDLSTEAKKNRAAKASAEYFNAGTLVVEDYVTIGRDLLAGNKAPEANNKVETQTVTLKKGDLTYTKADGTKGTMVAAPYFNYDANGGGITMVPIRAIGEILGAEVEWSQATQTATFTMADGRFAQITLNSAVARAIDGSTLTMNWKAEIPAGVDGGIYAPIRYMARVLGFADDTVSYDYANQCVVINAPVVK